MKSILTILKNPKYRNIVNGLIIAFGTASGSALLQMAEVWASSPNFSFDKVGFVLAIKHGVLACGIYLIKNLLTTAKTDPDAKS